MNFFSFITIPSTTDTSTTSIQMYDNVDSTSVTYAPLNTFQQQVQDHISMVPASSQPFDDHESPLASHMQVQFAKSGNPVTIAPPNMQSEVELADSNHL